LPAYRNYSEEKALCLAVEKDHRAKSTLWGGCLRISYGGLTKNILGFLLKPLNKRKENETI